MARVSIDRHIPVPVPVADPGRREVSFDVGHQTVTLAPDEARRFGDQYMAALDRLNVAGTPVEVDRG